MFRLEKENVVKITDSLAKRDYLLEMGFVLVDEVPVSEPVNEPEADESAEDDVKVEEAPVKRGRGRVGNRG